MHAIESNQSGARRRVLIVCTGNIARSQMAEGWWRHLEGGRWDIFSAGTLPRQRVHPIAIRVMAECGIDISGHKPKSVEEFAAERFDVVVTVCAVAEQNCPQFTNAMRREFWPLDDPAIAGDDPEQQLAVFRRLRDELAEKIRSFLERHGV